MRYFGGFGWIFFFFPLKDLERSCDVTQELKVQAVPVPWQDVGKWEARLGMR